MGEYFWCLILCIPCTCFIGSRGLGWQYDRSPEDPGLNGKFDVHGFEGHELPSSQQGHREDGGHSPGVFQALRLGQDAAGQLCWPQFEVRIWETQDGDDHEADGNSCRWFVFFFVQIFWGGLNIVDYIFFQFYNLEWYNFIQYFGLEGFLWAIRNIKKFGMLSLE